MTPKVNSFEVGSKFLSIEYSVGDKEMTLILNLPDTLDYLYKTGSIDRWDTGETFSDTWVVYDAGLIQPNTETLEDFLTNTLAEVEDSPYVAKDAIIGGIAQKIVNYHEMLKTIPEEFPDITEPIRKILVP